jgi:hypothetical protein
MPAIAVASAVSAPDPGEAQKVVLDSKGDQQTARALGFDAPIVLPLANHLFGDAVRGVGNETVANGGLDNVLVGIGHSKKALSNNREHRSMNILYEMHVPRRIMPFWSGE